MNRTLLYTSVFLVALCGIVYELLIATTSTYLIGDAIWQFSLTIGLYMSALGLGAYLSKYCQTSLLDRFVFFELLLALLGGACTYVLMWGYAETDIFQGIMVVVTLAVGTLVGVEIPLLMRLLENDLSLRDNAAHVLSWDYVGGLVGSLVFPLLLLPSLGLLKATFAIGLINALVAGLLVWRGRLQMRRPRVLGMTILVAVGLLGTGLWQGDRAAHAIEQRLYRDPVVVSQETPYQHITVTQSDDDLRLFLNGNLQFCSLDEYRYHEALVQIPMGLLPRKERVLILGGGDGMALREVLKHPVKEVMLVDLDQAMVELCRTDPRLKALHGGSLDDPRVQLVFADAFKTVERLTGLFDLIVIDLPDPETPAMARLYSREFYRKLSHHLTPDGLMVTQATSPFFSPQAFWTIGETLTQAGMHVTPYHVDVPSFGDWGFQLGGHHAPHWSRWRNDVALRYLTPDNVASHRHFGRDVSSHQDQSASTLLSPRILQAYRAGWRD